MIDFSSIKSPIEADLLISFFDLTNFIKISNSLSTLELFDALSQFYELAGSVVEKSGGRVIKFIGDAGLAVFSEEYADAGVRSLIALQKETGRFFTARGLQTRLIVKAHFGRAACGPLGTLSDKRIDVIGDAVNTAATLASKGFAISPQVFRKLSAETRRYFAKLTPPITYILSE